MPIDLRKFLEVLIFSVTKPKEFILRNVNLKFGMGVRSSHLIPLYRVSLYFLDFLEFVSYGQFSSMTVNASLISTAKIIIITKMMMLMMMIIMIMIIMIIVIIIIFQPSDFYAGSTTAIEPSAL